jgi:uncharacterized protein YbjT (DUF2867 family)
MSRKTIAVVGATGAQGGGLVRAILQDPDGEFAARALTRNPESDRAKALADLGAEVVAADLDDLDSLVDAFRNAYGAFCLTNFWEHFSPEKEMEQAERMATAAEKNAVSHLLWSTLEDTRQWVPLDDDRMPTLMGQYKVPHFDAKGASNHLFVDHGVPTTFLLTSFYWDNLIHFGMGPRRGEDGNLVFVLPMGDAKLPGIAVEDIGRCAYGVFKKGNGLVGRSIGIAGEHLTGAEMAAEMSKAFGQTVVHVSPPFDVYRGFDFPGADDLGNMFQFKHDFQDVFCEPRGVEGSRELNPALQSFAEWLAANKERIPVAE